MTIKDSNNVNLQWNNDRLDFEIVLESTALYFKSILDSLPLLGGAGLGGAF